MKSLVWLVAVGAVLAAPLPRYEAKRAAPPMQIDGQLSEPAWEAAARVELVSPLPTKARLLWDDNFLYVGFECDGPMTAGDSVMIQVNPKPAQTDGYIGLEIDAKANARSYLSAGGYTFRQFRMQGVRVSTYVRENGWTAEVAIPWSNFDDLSRQHGAGVTWTANLSRRGGSAAEQAKPEQFGELVFVK